MNIAKCSSLELLSYVWLCDTMDCSTSGLPVHHQFLEFTQTHVHWVSDAIKPSNPLSSSSPAFTIPQQGSFQMSQVFASGGQSIGVLASTSVLPMSIEDWFLLGWTGWISLQSQGLSKVFSNTTDQSINSPVLSFLYSSNPYMTTGKTIALTRWIFIGKVTSLFLNMLHRMVITFLPRSKHLLISWLQSPSAVILEPPKINSVTVSTVPHLFAMKWWNQMPWS